MKQFRFELIIELFISILLVISIMFIGLNSIYEILFNLIILLVDISVICSGRTIRKFLYEVYSEN